MASYDIGDTVHIAWSYVDQNGDPTDPTDPTIHIRPGYSTTVTTYVYPTDTEVAREDVGEYYIDFVAVVAGTHYWRAAGEDPVQTAGEGSFYVRPSQIIPYLPVTP